jgi:mRNA interferase HigB
LHIISRKKLLEVAKKHGSALGAQLDAWYRTAKAANWQNLKQVRQTYSHADGVRVGENTYTVFNIGGNNFRIIAEIFYENQTILIRHVLTHAEYDKDEWKK